jgi:hypothetical protein
MPAADSRTDPRQAGGSADPSVEEKRQLETRVEAMLSDAGTALETQHYDDAIARYDEILKLDPHQQTARIGRATAVNSKVAPRTVAAPGSGRDRAFVASKTSAASGDAGPDRAFSQAFEEGPGLDVRQETRPSRPPGRIEFEARPEAPRAGDRYSINVFLANPAKAPIEIGEVIVINTVNGRKASGPVTPATRTVAPEQRALLLSLSDFLPENVETWSLEVVARTSRGETYRNDIAWR